MSNLTTNNNNTNNNNTDNSNTNMRTINTEDNLERHIGITKWFSNKLGYGFITYTDKSNVSHDVFVHHTSIKPQKTTYRTLTLGEYVEFSLTVLKNNDKKQAINVTGVFNGPLLSDSLDEYRNDRSSYHSYNDLRELNDLNQRRINDALRNSDKSTNQTNHNSNHNSNHNHNHNHNSDRNRNFDRNFDRNTNRHRNTGRNTGRNTSENANANTTQTKVSNAVPLNINRNSTRLVPNTSSSIGWNVLVSKSREQNKQK
jgi:cold shock CspA family protein